MGGFENGVLNAPPAANLTASDRELFEGLRIEAEILQSAQVHRVDDSEARALLCCGRRVGLMNGVAFPFLNPTNGQTRTYRIRRDVPDQKDGKTHAKYMCPAGDRRYLYFAPNAAGLLADVAVPVVVVEAEKSVLSIASAAKRRGDFWLPLGTGGCYGWRCRTGKVETPDGRSIDQTGPLPDFDLIDWAGRNVVIVFDSNSADSPSVQKARRDLARELETRGANVRVVDVPRDGGVNGPDDFIGRYGDAKFFELLAAASAEDSAVTPEDFYAFMPDHSYIFAPLGVAWPAASVNARLKPVSYIKNGKPASMPATVWLDQNRAVEAMAWCPGLPVEIRDRLLLEGGWIPRRGARMFNMYTPPRRQAGDPADIGPWLDHLIRTYSDYHRHLLSWFAHRIQRPSEKINHALVLGGHHGIGKDCLLHPVKIGVGPWNVKEITPSQLLGRFNGFVKSVLLSINEAGGTGDVDRRAFYERMKIYAAAPPEVLLCDEKNIREHAVLNVTGVVITTNHKTDGIFLPADDRRHYVAWSDVKKEDYTVDYWDTLWSWLEGGGTNNVVAFLSEYDLADFSPKAAPPKTPAWHAIVDANREPEDAEFADALDRLSHPNAVTLADIAKVADEGLAEIVRDRRAARQMARRLERVGYVACSNDTLDGMWQVSGRRQMIYVKQTLPAAEQVAAARALARRPRC